VNRPLRLIAVAALIMFVALLINSTVVQVGEASSLRANPHNVRVLYSEYSDQRGPILVGGTEVARSVRTNDALKYLRTYPGGAVYAPVTGFYSLALGPSALEQAEDPTLAGTDDSLFFHRISDEITGRTPQGGSVVTTLDAKAQQAAYAGLKASGHPGAVVALDPSTGAILALASYPSYDPTSLSTHNSRSDTQAYHRLLKAAGDPLLDRALNQTYPPGSTFKVVTTAAALSSGKYTPTSLVAAPNALTLPQTTHQLTNFAGETCGPGGKITLTLALTVSCNTAYGGLGLALGNDALSRQAKLFGFGQSLKTPLESSPSRYSGSATGPNVAFSAIGQYDDAVTPLQMAMVASGIADDGVVMKPYLVAQTRAPNASVLTTAHPAELGRAVSTTVAAELTTMMQQVVSAPDGTGRAAAIPGVAVAAKTGTAQNVAGQQAHAWFISFAPAAHPTVAVAVVVEHGGQGGIAAAPIARSVMCAVLGCS
jgi:peptidoglycan glycosyltransferase